MVMRINNVVEKGTHSNKNATGEPQTKLLKILFVVIVKRVTVLKAV